MSRISDLAGFTTALSTTEDLSVGIITATSFSGDGSGLTGVASTDNIQTATDAKFLANVNITGITTATGGFVGALTGNATGLSGTPNITVGSVSAASGTFSGNVTIGGTLTYQDVTNIDAVGIITAQQGIQVLANGLTITGVSTFNDNIDLQDDDKILLGSDDDLEIYHGSGVSRIDNNVGDIRIRNFADDAKIKIQTDNGSGSHTDYIICDGSNGETQLYYYGSEKLNTSNTGVTVTGNLLPEANGTRDLGATGTRWANLYTSDIDLSNEAKGGNEVDGTWGSYTIQEGENDLFLINRRTGKTFKFVLEEIN